MERYVQFVEEGLSRGSIWADLSQQVYLGRDDFIDQIKLKLSDRDNLTEVPRMQWKQAEKSLDEYVDKAGRRNTAMALAYLEGGHRMNEIAQRFGVHYATVSLAVKKMETVMYDCKT